jgi:hypothetical protein
VLQSVSPKLAPYLTLVSALACGLVVASDALVTLSLRPAFSQGSASDSIGVSPAGV